MLPYIKIFADTGATVDMLSDAEAGRLLKALLHYNTSGKEDSLPGQERLIFAMLKAQIDRDNNSYATKCETLRENGKKGGRPKNQTKPNGFLKKQMIGKTKCFQEEEKEEEQEQEYDKDQDQEHEQEGENARTREDPFNLSSEEITESLSRDDRITQSAQAAGLPVSETALVKARNMAREYGLEKLIAAIEEASLSAQRPNWRYVEGILEGRGSGGKQTEHKRDTGSDTKQDDYSWLTGVITV